MKHTYVSNIIIPGGGGFGKLFGLCDSAYIKLFIINIQIKIERSWTQDYKQGTQQLLR